MQLYEPSRLHFLLLILLGGGLFWWGNTQWHRRLSQLGNEVFIRRRLTPGLSIEKRRWAWFLVLTTFFFSTLALARPQWGEEKKKIERKGVDLVFLLDTSLSMLAEDVKPSRIGKSKLVIKNMIHRLKGDRVGMVAFSGSSFLQCPLTLDYAAFLLFVDAVKVGYIPNPGTSLANAIELGLRAFPEESRKYRAMILFTDGEDHEGGLEQVLNAAKKSGIRVYAVGTGTVDGEPIPLREAGGGKISGYKKDRQGQVVVTRLNQELLEKIAKETGGLYLPATPSENEVDIILKHLETLGERQLKERLVTEREDRFQLFLLIAFLLLVGETILGNKSRKAATLAALLAFSLFTGFINTPHSLVQKGNREVQEKKYKSAVENYRKAEITRPDEPVIRYNLGTALYHLYEYRDAEKELEQALGQAKDPATKARILYNYGNAQYRLGNFDKAIDSYKKVLELNPRDEDAKYNLEFLKNKKSQFEKKQRDRQQQKNKQQQPNQQQQDQNQSQPKPKPQNQQDQNKQPQPQEGQEQGQDQSQDQKEKGSQGNEGEQDHDRKKDQDQSEQQPAQNQDKQKKDQGDEQQKQQEQKSEPEQQNQQQQEQEKGQDQKNQQFANQADQSQEQKQQPRSLQGQMSTDNALHILEALREGEKQLQDLRRPPVNSDSEEVEKDW